MNLSWYNPGGMKDRHDTPRRLMFFLVAFFAIVILYFLWERFDIGSWKTAPPKPAAKPYVPPAARNGGDAGLPSYLPGIKIDRIEKRKYRREPGQTMPAPAKTR